MNPFSWLVTALRLPVPEQRKGVVSPIYSLRMVLTQDIGLIAVLMVVAFFLANSLEGGSARWWKLPLAFPLDYQGDALSYLWNIQRQMEGHWYHSARSGYPFLSNFLDYPASDSGNYWIASLLGHAAGLPAAYNLYYLLGFSLAAASSYIVYRSLGVGRAFGIAGALLYSFLPFHFERISHLFFRYYFVAPLYIWVGLRLFFVVPSRKDGAWPTRAEMASVLALLAGLACFGVYYALFGLLVVGVCALLAAATQRNWYPLLAGACAVAVTAASLALNMAPSLWQRWQEGPNPQALARQASESETYALKMAELLLPRQNHRIASWDTLSTSYYFNFPLNNENATATLGVVGSMGMLCLLATALILVLSRRIGRNIASSFRVLTVLFLVLLLFATVGGFSSLVANFVSTSVRGWNRLSVFLAFIAIGAAVAQLERWSRPLVVRSKILPVLLAVCVAALGVLDQTSAPCSDCFRAQAMGYAAEQRFYAQLEQSVPAAAAIYQIPYMPYPEAPSRHGLDPYGQAKAPLLTRTLRWSYGNVRGSDGDLFFRHLSTLPITDQLIVVRVLGFSGVLVNTDAYPPEGGSASLSHQYGQEPSLPQITDALVQMDPSPLKVPSLAFYRLPSVPSDQVPTQLARANAIMGAFGYEWVDHRLQMRPAPPTRTWIASDKTVPYWIRDLTGWAEPDQDGAGRWTDATQAPYASMWLTQALSRKVSLDLELKAFAANIGVPLVVRIGRVKQTLVPTGQMASYHLDFELVEEGNRRIDILPAHPALSMRYGGDPGDHRILGIQVKRLTIVSQDVR